MAETFKLPCSSYEELIKLFQAYANTKEGTALSLDEITQATGVPRTIVSKNNGFMVQVGLITEGNKKAATETGRALGRAYTSKITDEVERIWKEIIAEVDFLNRMLSAVRIRNGMDRSSFINHIIYSSGLKDAKESRAGAGALIEIFKSVGVLSEVDGKLSVLDEPSSARVSVASNTISAEQTHSEPVAQQALPVATISANELACRQTKTLHMMTSNERDVKNTLISIATYAKALKSEGANLYSFVEDVDAVGIIEAALRSANITENSLRTYWGENLYTFVNTSNVFAPLIEALQKTHSGTMDVRSIVVCAANAFESFLADFAVRKGVSLSGRNGILQKRDALSAHISKKHRGMIEFVGQVRNAADHGADPDENNQVWTISNETARIYPCIIAALIKAIFSRDATGSIEV